MNAKELLKLIQERRSVFPPQYTTETISKEELDLVLEAANWAPTHKKTEPWRFKIVQGDSKKSFADFMRRIYVTTTDEKAYSDKKLEIMLDKVEKSNVVLIISFVDEGDLPEWEELAATSMAVQNAWLMCTALGIGAYWSSPAPYISNMDSFVPMEEGEKCVGIFYMGKLNGELAEGKRKPIADKVKWM